MRTWKSDTATAIDSHPGLASRYREIEELQTRDLYLCLQNVLSRNHNSTDTMSSIDKGIVAPAIALARKVGVRYPTWSFPLVIMPADNNRFNQHQASGILNTLNGATANQGS